MSTPATPTTPRSTFIRSSRAAEHACAFCGRPADHWAAPQGIRGPLWALCADCDERPDPQELQPELKPADDPGLDDSGMDWDEGGDDE